MSAQPITYAFHYKQYAPNPCVIGNIIWDQNLCFDQAYVDANPSVLESIDCVYFDPIMAWEVKYHETCLNGCSAGACL